MGKVLWLDGGGWVRGCLVPWILLLASGECWAHKLNVFAYPEGAQVRVESYYSRGAACSGCVVEVLDGSQTVLLKGQLNDEGVWAFVPPRREGLEIRVNAGEGHGSSYVLTAEDYPTPGETGETVSPQLASEDSDSSEWEMSEPAAHEHPHDPEHGHTHGEEATVDLTISELESIVDRVVERKVAPLRRSLAQAAIQEPGITEILGGIGYILGLFGVGTYFLSRSKGTG